MTDSAVPAPALRIRLPVRLAAFGASAVAAVYLGFLCFDPVATRTIFRQTGYYFIASSFLLWVMSIWWSMRGANRLISPGWRELFAAGLTIAVFTGIALSQETFRSKILYDEFVLQATAYNMHFLRDCSAIVRGYDIQGFFLPLDFHVDKRPLFFPYLISLVHDLTGFRPANVYILNGLLFSGTLAAVYALGRQLNGWRGGFVGVALLGSLPLFAQNASGAGMELLNLGMLVAAILAGAAWIRRPGAERLSVFVLTLLLLVQSRYESVVYLLPAILLIFLGWWRLRQIVISWAFILAPLLLLPVAWQQVVIATNPLLWELRSDQASRFSATYLPGNLRAAWDFLSDVRPVQANSLLILALGIPAIVLVGWRVLRSVRRWGTADAIETSVGLFGLGMIGVTGMVMFYYWAAFNDPQASRFALTLNFLLVLAIVVMVRWGDRAFPASAVTLGLATLFLVGISIPKQALHFYSHVGIDEIEWERRLVEGRTWRSQLVLTNKSTLPWMIDRVPAIMLERARLMADRLDAHLHLPDFNEILVLQSSRPTSAEGQYVIVPEDRLPSWFHLELIAERRFGTKLARISRLVGIDLPKDFKSSISSKDVSPAPKD